MDRDIAYKLLCEKMSVYRRESSWSSLYSLAGQTRSEHLHADDGTPLLLELRFTDADGDIRIDGSIDSASCWRLERIEEAIVITRREIRTQMMQDILEKNAELYRRLADS